MERVGAKRLALAASDCPHDATVPAATATPTVPAEPQEARPGDPALATAPAARRCSSWDLVGGTPTILAAISSIQLGDKGAVVRAGVDPEAANAVFAALQRYEHHVSYCA